MYGGSEVSDRFVKVLLETVGHPSADIVARVLGMHLDHGCQICQCFVEFFLADVGLGSTVRKGDLLGTITDPMNNVRTELRSPYSGRIIGMARNQVVMPGFAAFHVGIQTDEAPVEAVTETSVSDSDDDSVDYVDGMSE